MKKKLIQNYKKYSELLNIYRFPNILDSLFLPDFLFPSSFHSASLVQFSYIIHVAFIPTVIIHTSHFLPSQSARWSTEAPPPLQLRWNASSLPAGTPPGYNLWPTFSRLFSLKEKILCAELPYFQATHSCFLQRQFHVHGDVELLSAKALSCHALTYRRCTLLSNCTDWVTNWITTRHPS
jgi:hypothetical protein